MIRHLQKHPQLIVAASGLLAGGVFSFGFSPLLLPLCLAVLIYNILYSKYSRLSQTLLYTSIFFWAFYIVVLIWLLDVDTRTLVGLSTGSSKLFLVFWMMTMASVLTLASFPFAILLYVIKPKLKNNSLLTLAVLASGWVVIEWLRSLTFSLFLFAPEASVGDYWNFGSLGLGIVDTPVGFLSQYVGMYGMSMLVVTFSISLVWATKKQFKPALVMLSLVIITSIIGILYQAQPMPANKLKASVLQLDSNGTESFTNNGTDIKYLDRSLKDLIVLSEYSRIYSDASKSYIQQYITNRLSENGVSLDVSDDFMQPNRRYNILVARNKSNDSLQTQSKQLLIPTGEYMPKVVHYFNKLFGYDDINQDFDNTRRLDKGQPPRVINTGSIKIAPVACSGILSRGIYRQLAREGGEVLTNSASLVVFRNSKAYFRQSIQLARFHAVANQRTYIQASNAAPAFVIDHNGKFVVPPEDTKSAFIDFSFTPKSNQTLYTRYGDWPLVLSAVFLLTYTSTSVICYLLNRAKQVELRR